MLQFSPDFCLFLGPFGRRLENENIWNNREWCVFNCFVSGCNIQKKSSKKGHKKGHTAFLTRLAQCGIQFPSDIFRFVQVSQIPFGKGTFDSWTERNRLDQFKHHHICQTLHIYFRYAAWTVIMDLGKHFLFPNFPPLFFHCTFRAALWVTIKSHGHGPRKPYCWWAFWKTPSSPSDPFFSSSFATLSSMFDM